MDTKVYDLTAADFSTVIEAHPGVSLVDFWAEWCGPCRMIAPIVNQIATEYAGKVRVAKINVDESPELAARFGIRSIPTLLILKDGVAVDTVVGALPKKQIADRLEKVLG